MTSYVTESVNQSRIRCVISENSKVHFVSGYICLFISRKRLLVLSLISKWTNLICILSPIHSMFQCRVSVSLITVTHLELMHWVN